MALNKDAIQALKTELDEINDALSGYDDLIAQRDAIQTLLRMKAAASVKRMPDESEQTYSTNNFRGDIRTLLQEAGINGLTPKEAEKLANERGIKPGGKTPLSIRISNELSKLVSLEQAKKTDHGRYISMAI